MGDTHRRTPFGADVYVLDTGAAITAEAEAMLQALHSRSTGGLKAHRQKLAAKGSRTFMETYYVGYGDKSIGDCGTVTVFAEGISMLAAKAVQDWPLYSGQESSTRYLDFSKQPFMDITAGAGKTIQETWREFYLSIQEPVRALLGDKYPRKDDEDEKVWEKAIRARAFDITRAFLPAGATTNIAWHTNLRQAADKLALLRHHPLPEVVALAEAMESALQEHCPNSFGQKRYETTEAYNAEWMAKEYYFHDPASSGFAVDFSNFRWPDHLQSGRLLRARPPKTELPRFLDQLGQLEFRFTLDFGSFRDIQRHRAITQRMPLLTEDLGFHPWYLSELPLVWRREASRLLEHQRRMTDTLGLPRELRQYYLPMGYNVSCWITGGLPQVVYLVELRATRFVHPTLRARAEEMAQTLVARFGHRGLALHLDKEPGRFDIRRGTHDIVEK